MVDEDAWERAHYDRGDLSDEEQVAEDHARERIQHHDHVLVRAEKRVTDEFVAKVSDEFDPYDERLNAEIAARVVAWLEHKGFHVMRGVGFSDDPPALLEERVEFWEGEQPTVFFPRVVETYEDEQEATWAICAAALHLGERPSAFLADAVKPRHPLEQLAMGGDDDSR